MERQTHGEHIEVREHSELARPEALDVVAARGLVGLSGDRGRWHALADQQRRHCLGMFHRRREEQDEPALVETEDTVEQGAISLDVCTELRLAVGGR